jgi:protein-tyrosine phosphatase
MIDLHCHVLPGIDDGPATFEGSLALARSAAAGGIGVLVATPHVNWRYRNDAQTIAALVAEINERIAAAGIETAAGDRLEVRAGAEIALTLAGETEPAELRRLTLGGGEWLLVEPPFSPVAPNLDVALLNIQRSGYRIVLAHPERCPAFHRDPEAVRRLVQAGALTSVTAGSLVGRFGGEARRFALTLARDGLLHNVASDAHDELQRPPAIARELEQAGLGPLADWLTQAIPAAILDGGEIPPRPTVATQRRRWRPLRS